MKVLVVGASGLIGSAVVEALKTRGDEVIEASRSGKHKVDLTDPVSIKALFNEIGKVDAIAATAGHTPFKPLKEMEVSDFEAGLDDKFLGQVSLVKIGTEFLNDGGSFALMSGVLGDDPIIMGSVASSVNGAIQAFTRAAAIELPRGIRINNIAPTILAEAKPAVIALFPGEIPVPAFEVGQAYVKAIHGAHTGQTIRVGYVPGGK